MSSFAGYCSECGKPVMHKTLFGTLHLCLSDSAEIRQQQQQPSSEWLYKLRQTKANEAVNLKYSPSREELKGD